MSLQWFGTMSNNALAHTSLEDTLWEREDYQVESNLVSK